MRHRRFLIVLSVMCVLAFFGFGGVAFGAPPDGMYVGTTDQGRDFEVRVSGGRVDQWMINFSVSCGFGGASGGVRTTISPSCAIESDGRFISNNSGYRGDAVDQQQVEGVIAGAKVAGAGGVASVGSGLWVWLGNNNNEIAAICSIVGAACALGGLLYSIHKGTHKGP